MGCYQSTPAAAQRVQPVAAASRLDWCERLLGEPIPRDPPSGRERQRPSAEDKLDPREWWPTGRFANAVGETSATEHEDELISTVKEPAAGSKSLDRLALRPAGMRIIAVASQKGGSGKTTIAGHLAVQAGLASDGPSLVVDTDPQGSLADWWRARKNDAPALAKVSLEELEANLAELRSYGTAVMIIDTPPAMTYSIELAMAIADLVVIPARPSPHDLRAVGATVMMCRRAGKPFVFVLNGAAPRANITAEAAAALSEHGRVSPVILHQRTEYAAAMIDGRTVLEAAPSGKSAQEIAALWNFIQAQITLRVAV